MIEEMRRKFFEASKIEFISKWKSRNHLDYGLRLIVDNRRNWDLLLK